MNTLIATINNYICGPILLPLLTLAGILLSFGYLFFPQRKLYFAFKQLVKKTDSKLGDISPFRALMTSLSATVGTGNIVGVATAIFMGGPGALFWMWCIAFLGMATKFSEAILAIKFREVDENGHFIGGPMYYIKNGLGKHWIWLATIFAFFGMCAGAGIGNTVQSNAVANALHNLFGIHPIITGIACAILTGFVLLGGIQRIGAFTSKIVPFMGITYFVACLFILIVYIDQIPNALIIIVKSAFAPESIEGGLTGVTIWTAMQFGVARGIFSNEAGMGSSPIAHASAQTNSPFRQATVATLDVFIDTLVIATLTGLVIVVTGSYRSGLNGVELSTCAFNLGIPFWGKHIISISLSLFALTTLIGWSFFSERCAQYLFGTRAIIPYRIVWVLLIPVGTIPFIDLSSLWLVADILNALMAIPNLIAIVLLSPFLFRLIKRYRKKFKVVASYKK